MDSTPLAAGTVQAPDYAVTHPLRPRVIAGTATLLAYGCAVLVVIWLVRPYVAAAHLLVWSVAEGLFLASWAAIVGGYHVRQPSAKDAVLIWEKGARYIIVASQIGVVWALFAFVPAVPELVGFVLLGMFLFCSPAQIIASPENVAANRIGIALSYGAVIAYLLIYATGYALALAAFVFGIGAMLFLLCDVVPKTVAATVEGRLASEEAVARLAAANAALLAERDAKTQFIAAASHDLGQPLQAANLFFGQLVRAQDPDRRERAADGVRKAFDAAEQLLSHMLNHLRLEADAVQPQLAPVSLNDVLSRLVIQFGPLAEAQGVRLRHVPTRKRLVTDRVLLERALGNLVDNALRHSGAKRLLLGVRSIDPARIWIIDDGVGISPSEQDRIFEDYFRGSDSRAVTKVGFGLGLASVRRIAQLLGGECAVDPRWTKGAAFKLELPAGKAKP